MNVMKVRSKRIGYNRRTRVFLVVEFLDDSAWWDGSVNALN